MSANRVTRKVKADNRVGLRYQQKNMTWLADRILWIPAMSILPLKINGFAGFSKAFFGRFLAALLARY